jgi:hypothetical protein
MKTIALIILMFFSAASNADCTVFYDQDKISNYFQTHTPQQYMQLLQQCVANNELDFSEMQRHLQALQQTMNHQSNTQISPRSVVNNSVPQHNPSYGSNNTASTSKVIKNPKNPYGQACVTGQIEEYQPYKQTGVNANFVAKVILSNSCDKPMVVQFVENGRKCAEPKVIKAGQTMTSGCWTLGKDLKFTYEYNPYMAK